ncbi:Rho termination factor N-terminal domain-containing protein [Pseudomonas sp. GD03842]|uniref:Rho termination factor N-terminal domain-containing protein n=1 Tax=Pseudomonas sp. GD03842 TaxID=2975385 RepID=UPI0024475158|nr:Rho termination factor N-terminal domain-containing protein [Pseudomonas sp. GD03842]MDH0748366.1 Rho termination factor N-terminal domain-containing protein [Pseudomonas sp. GD03842]
MPTRNKDTYTAEQKRKAAHIEDSYESKGLSKGEAEARAWATVNKQSGGGEKKGGSGTRKAPSAKAHDRKDSAKRAAATRHGAPRSRGQPLDSQTKVDLMQRARGLNIKGRSTMTKEELITAIRKSA